MTLVTLAFRIRWTASLRNLLLVNMASTISGVASCSNFLYVSARFVLNDSSRVSKYVFQSRIAFSHDSFMFVLRPPLPVTTSERLLPLNELRWSYSTLGDSRDESRLGSVSVTLDMFRGRNSSWRMAWHRADARSLCFAYTSYAASTSL